MLHKNIGREGRILRALIACGVLAFAWWQTSWLALLVALFIFFEAGASWCLWNQITGKNSCPKA